VLLQRDGAGARSALRERARRSSSPRDAAARSASTGVAAFTLLLQMMA
jgi:hypothetical protein